MTRHASTSTPLRSPGSSWRALTRPAPDAQCSTHRYPRGHRASIARDRPTPGHRSALLRSSLTRTRLRHPRLGSARQITDRHPATHSPDTKLLSRIFRRVKHLTNFRTRRPFTSKPPFALLPLGLLVPYTRASPEQPNTLRPPD